MDGSEPNGGGRGHLGTFRLSCGIVFTDHGGPGWRASQKGEQQIRLIFDQTLAVRRIQLHFLEPVRERLQDARSAPPLLRALIASTTDLRLAV